MRNKKKAKRRKTVRPAALANAIFAWGERDHGTLLRTYDDLLDPNDAYGTHERLDKGNVEPFDSLFHIMRSAFSST